MNIKKKPIFKPFIIFSSLLFSVIALTSFISFGKKDNETAIKILPASSVSAEEIESSMINSLFEEIGLVDKGLNFKAFEMAFKGLKKLGSKDNQLESDLITIIDFSQPSTQKRLYVIDINSKEVLYQTYVAHGKNSGAKMATRFSNKISSYQSSLGFYKTANTYNGKHGYSLRLEGLEPGINSNALSRAIVMHSADYVSEKTISSLGYLGRSLGCPAIPKELNKPIINLIKGGTLMFIYHPAESYLKQSQLAG